MRTIRRVLAVALFLLAGALAMAPRPGPGGTGLVWTAARSLPTGRTLSTGDLTATATTDPPEGALSAATRIDGRVLAAPVRRGEVLTDVRLVEPSGPDPGPGRVAVPVRPADPGVVDLLAPGAHVAVVGGTTGGAVRRLADDAVVLSVRAPPGGRIGMSGGSDGALVVLAVPAAQADQIVATALTGSVGLRFA